MAKEKKEFLGFNGGSHLAWALASYLIVYFIFKIKLAITICFIINTIIWLAFEITQEKKMFDDGRRKENNSWKILKWSRSRHEDWMLPTAVGIIFLIIT